MPPIPPMPPPGMAGAPVSFFGFSATMASVVISRLLKSAVFWRVVMFDDQSSEQAGLSAANAPHLVCFCLIFDTRDRFMLLRPEVLEFE